MRLSRRTLGWLLSGIAILVGGSMLHADEGDATKVEQERKERYTNWMKQYAQDTQVLIPKTEGQDEQRATMHPNAVFRYSDEEHAIPDATLWVWLRDNRPVAFQKVEGNNHGGGQMWTICFASLSEKLITVRWPGGRDFETRKPGLKFQPIPGADPPSDNPRARAVQIKSLKDRFSARLGISDLVKPAESRTMAKALFEYSDPETKLPIGAIFGMTSTGTNPSLLLLIEARQGDDGKPRWEYAHARMTSSAVQFRLDDNEVWTEKQVPSGSFDNWIYYFLRRDFK
jgi:hypothetical protein